MGEKHNGDVSFVPSEELQLAIDDFKQSMLMLHTAISRDRGLELGAVTMSEYNETTKILARTTSDSIMMALAGPKSTHLFNEIMIDAIRSTMRRSKNGAVCPCCGEPWH